MSRATVLPDMVVKVSSCEGEERGVVHAEISRCTAPTRREPRPPVMPSSWVAGGCAVVRLKLGGQHSRQQQANPDTRSFAHLHRQVSGHQGKEVAGLAEGVLPHLRRGTRMVVRLH